MSSNIRLKKTCQHCGQSFIAQTTVTKFCSLSCAQRNYKKRKREEKITQTILAVNDQSIERFGLSAPDHNSQQGTERMSCDWINIRGIAELLGIGERTLYRAIKEKSFPKIKIGRRLLFSKKNVIEYFTSKNEGI